MIAREGRPEALEGREARETRTYDLLEQLGISYLQVDHAPAETMEDCIEIDAALGATMCKNLFLCNRQQTDFYLLMMPGDKPFRTKELSSQLGVARLSFASAEHMVQYLDIYPGAVSVMGLMNDTEGMVQLLIDEDLLDGEYVGVHPCVNTASLRIRIADLLDVFLPAVKHVPRKVRLLGE